MAALHALLAEDATFAMPPLTTWYTPRAAVIDWARNYALNGEWRWKTVRTRANGAARGRSGNDEASGRAGRKGRAAAWNTLILRKEPHSVRGPEAEK